MSARDAVNRQILEVSEDRLQGFVRDPIGEIAKTSGVGSQVVTERIRAMMRAGVIRRVRQTVLATSLSQGALVAWKIAENRAQDAFQFIAERDPFSGHIAIRDSEREPSEWRLWTTLKVPGAFSIEKHCDYLLESIGAEQFRIMPALRSFVLGVGHMRRKGMKVGQMSAGPAKAMTPAIVDLDWRDWEVLTILKRDFAVEEIGPEMWERRAMRAGVDPAVFFEVAESLNRRGVIGRFSTFLEHSGKVAGEEQVASFNGLFQWAVPAGREIEAGCQIGRFAILTHCYWRDGGPELNHVNIMAVAHGESKDQVLAHKAAIDKHIVESGIGLNYTNVYWGNRAEIKPSEISPVTYREWAKDAGL